MRYGGNMKVIVLLVTFLVFCPPVIFGEVIVFKSKFVQSEAFTTIDDIGNIQYHTINRQYYFLKQLLESVPFLLILEEKEESQFLGDEVSKSKIKLTAWAAEEGKIISELWQLESNGHNWKVVRDTIIITIKGCCDQSDKKNIYDLKSGKFKEEK